MTESEFVSLKERIALSADYTPAERDFILRAVNEAAPKAIVVQDPGNYLQRIEGLWAVLSMGSDGEGLCAAPMGGMTMPLIAADEQRLNQIIPLARRLLQLTGRDMRLVRFGAREDVRTFSKDNP